MQTLPETPPIPDMLKNIHRAASGEAELETTGIDTSLVLKNIGEITSGRASDRIQKLLAERLAGLQPIDEQNP